MAWSPSSAATRRSTLAEVIEAADLQGRTRLHRQQQDPSPQKTAEQTEVLMTTDLDAARALATALRTGVPVVDVARRDARQTLKPR